MNSHDDDEVPPPWYSWMQNVMDRLEWIEGHRQAIREAHRTANPSQFDQIPSVTLGLLRVP
jgi:hypothetical protein